MYVVVLRCVVSQSYEADVFAFFDSNEEYLIRALADIGAISQLHSSKQMTIIQTPGVQWLIDFNTTKTGICLLHFYSQSSTSKNK
jgi:hypothetical protein